MFREKCKLGSEKFLVKYSEKCIRKNNGNCFIKGKFHVHLNDCERTRFTLWTLEAFLHPRALTLHTPPPLETCFYYRIFHLCLPSYYDGNCWISHYRKPASLNIICGYYWQTQCQFLEKYENSVI